MCKRRDYEDAGEHRPGRGAVAGGAWFDPMGAIVRHDRWAGKDRGDGRMFAACRASEMGSKPQPMQGDAEQEAGPRVGPHLA